MILRVVTPAESLRAELARDKANLERHENECSSAFSRLADAYQGLLLDVTWLRRSMSGYWAAQVVTWTMLAWLLLRT